MKKLKVGLVVALACIWSDAQAGRFIRGGGTAASDQTPVGGAVLNLGEFYPRNYVNILKIGAPTLNPVTDMSVFDADGYPVSRPSGNINWMGNGITTDKFWTSTNYTYEGPSTRLTPLFFDSSDISNCQVISGSVTITGCTGSGQTRISPVSGNWKVTFDWGTNFGIIYLPSTGGTYAAGSGEVGLYRTSDAARYAAGTATTPEYDAAVSGSAGSPLRFMPLVNTGSSNFNNETQWAFRTKPTDFYWGGLKYPPNARAGGAGNPITVTNGGSSTTITAAATPVTPGSLTDGEVIVGVCSGANSFSATTLDVGSRGTPKPVLTWTASALNTSGDGINGIPSGSTPCFFTYKAIHDGWIYAYGGISWSLPIETQASLANRLNKHAWFVLPYMATDGYIDSWAAAACSALTSPRIGYFQYTNEEWNTNFPQWGYAYNAGYQLGWVLGSGKNIHSWYALRVKQMMDRVNTQCSGQLSRTRGVLDYQMGMGDYNQGIMDWRWGGAALFNNEVTTSAVTITVGSPCQITWPYNNLLVGWQIDFPSGGTLPTGLSTGVNYFIKTNTPNNDNIASTMTLSTTLGGADVNCSGPTSGVTGRYTNTLYAAKVGQNYSLASPTWSRPVDVAYGGGGAPYAVGENLCKGPDVECTQTSDNTSFLQALITAHEAGNTTLTNSMIDADMRAGRTLVQNVIASGTTFTTPAAHNLTSGMDVLFEVTGGTAYSGVEISSLYRITGTSTTSCPGAVACNFTMQAYGSNGTPSGANVNAGSAGTGTMTVGRSVYNTMARLASTWYKQNQTYSASFARPPGADTFKTILYEGAPEPEGPSSTTCVNLGLVTNPVDATGVACQNKINAAIATWKLSASAKATMIKYLQQPMGTDSSTPATFGLMTNAKLPGQLTLMCSDEYGLISGCDPSGTKNQTYDGFHDFSISNQQN